MQMRMTAPRAVATMMVIAALALSACGGGSKEGKESKTEEKSESKVAAAVVDAKLAAQGKTLADSNGCSGCHTADGKTSVGPTWKALYGHDVELLDGSKVKADDAYLRESIVKPEAKVVKGFTAGAMPATFSSLSDSDINALIEYIKSLQK